LQTCQLARWIIIMMASGRGANALWFSERRRA
jgi:hypothetical protein